MGNILGVLSSPSPAGQRLSCRSAAVQTRLVSEDTQLSHSLSGVNHRHLGDLPRPHWAQWALLRMAASLPYMPVSHLLLKSVLLSVTSPLYT